MIRSHIAGSVWVKNPNSSVPALLTRISNGPSSSTTALAEAAWVTSRPAASPPNSAATSRAPSWFRSPMTTLAASAARRRAIAAPIPLAPPVTSALRPSSLMRAGAYAHGAPWQAHPAKYTPPMREPIPIIGGTGALGWGLALRLARADRSVVIGSRSAERAGDAVARLRQAAPGSEAEGLVNADAARRGPIV